MHSGSPALDRARWISLWSRLGASGDAAPVFDELTAAYQEPVRAYHTTTHILHCLSEFDRSRSLAVRPDEVEAALWFHDAVYVPGAPDNEHRSALLAESALSRAGASPTAARQIGKLVLVTQHLSVPSDPDAQLICDIDLAILGQDARAYDQFEQQIRREYAWVPEPTYRRARSEILDGFLRRRSIYQTEDFRRRYEQRARSNLESRLAQLAGS